MRSSLCCLAVILVALPGARFDSKSLPVTFSVTPAETLRDLGWKQLMGRAMSDGRTGLNNYVFDLGSVGHRNLQTATACPTTVTGGCLQIADGKVRVVELTRGNNRWYFVATAEDSPDLSHPTPKPSN